MLNYLLLSYNLLRILIYPIMTKSSYNWQECSKETTQLGIYINYFNLLDWPKKLRYLSLNYSQWYNFGFKYIINKS